MRISDIAEQAMLYMNPENEWRYPRADAFLLYEFRNDGNHYATDFPCFTENRSMLFHKGLKGSEEEIVTHCSIVQHTDKSFAVPSRHMAHAYYFLDDIEGIISSKSDDLRKYMGMYDLRFQPGSDKLYFDKFIRKYKWYHFPRNTNSIVYPHPGSRYVYMEFVS